MGDRYLTAAEAAELTKLTEAQLIRGFRRGIYKNVRTASGVLYYSKAELTAAAAKRIKELDAAEAALVNAAPVVTASGGSVASVKASGSPAKSSRTSTAKRTPAKKRQAAKKAASRRR